MATLQAKGRKKLNKEGRAFQEFIIYDYEQLFFYRFSKATKSSEHLRLSAKCSSSLIKVGVSWTLENKTKFLIKR